MFMPYRKLAKLSLNLLRLSCINCRCMKLASRSAIESESSAKPASSDSRGNTEVPALGVNDWLSRREVRELGRSGVDGRDGGLVRVAEVERLGCEISILVARLPNICPTLGGCSNVDLLYVCCLQLGDKARPMKYG